MSVATCIRAIGDRIILRLDEAEQVSPGGVVLPESSQEAPKCGRVVAVGSGVRTAHGELIPLEVSEGGKVWFTPFSGHEVNVGDDKYHVIRESDVLLYED